MTFHTSIPPTHTDWTVSPIRSVLSHTGSSQRSIFTHSTVNAGCVKFPVKHYSIIRIASPSPLATSPAPAPVWCPAPLAADGLKGRSSARMALCARELGVKRRKKLQGCIGLNNIRSGERSLYAGCRDVTGTLKSAACLAGVSQAFSCPREKCIRISGRLVHEGGLLKTVTLPCSLTYIRMCTHDYTFSRSLYVCDHD